jgi:NTE family protein
VVHTNAFVLPGGGSLGAVQVGMLRALADAGIRPDLLVGASVGAFNAVVVAARPDGLEQLEAIWRSLRRRDLIQVEPLHALLGLIGRRDSLLPGRRTREFFERHIVVHALEDTVIPVVAVATDIDTGERVALERGDAVQACLASAAIPGIFPPVRIGDRTLVDGGLSASWPVGVAIERGATRVFVLDTADLTTMQRRRGALALFERGIDVLTDHSVELQRRSVQSRAEVEVIEIRPPHSAVSIFDLSSTAELIDAARASTAMLLGAAVQSVEPRSRPRRHLPHGSRVPGATPGNEN